MNKQYAISITIKGEGFTFYHESTELRPEQLLAVLNAAYKIAINNVVEPVKVVMENEKK